MTYKKKLIEVALPLDAINRESAREKSIRHGHPSTLHLWWARRPLAACRAVLFAQMVDDPSAHPDKFPTEEEQARERERLFDIIRELVKWENINNETVLEAARREIRKSAPPGGPPPVLDPFAGGGSIPLEAQRLGLEAHASDLNPVAVLINKALIEIPPKFAGEPPVNPDSPQAYRWYKHVERRRRSRRRCTLLRKMDARRGRAAHRPSLPQGQAATGPGRRRGHRHRLVVGTYGQMPQPSLWRADAAWLAPSGLSKKKGKQAWVEPIVDRSHQPAQVRFTVKDWAWKTG